MECRSLLIKVYHTLPFLGDRKSRPIGVIDWPESNTNTGRSIGPYAGFVVAKVVNNRSGVMGS